MKKAVVLSLVIFLSCGKQNSVKTQEPHQQKDETVQEQKSDVERPADTITPSTPIPSEGFPEDGSTYNDDGNRDFIGEHKMVWKFLPESNATLYITKMTNGNLDATGGTTAYGSSFSLEGEIKKISQQKLEFNGKIKTFQYGRNGYHCEYNGKAIFTENRDKSSWRYSFNDCKGVSDHIDIFE